MSISVSKAPPAPAAEPQVPGIAGRYRVIKTLGSGGMGDVYLAQDLKLPRRVAIKTLRKDLCESAEVRKRVERECQLHARIGVHPHIVTLYDRLEQGDQISLVLEYVDGETLREIQQRVAQKELALPWRHSVEIVCQCLDALARIHTYGIVHRDVKPSNILLGRDDAGHYCAKLMDFGIARPELQEGTMLTRQELGSPGTPLYMAPEQIDPQTFGAVSPATDLYALGVVLYHLLAGKPPFEGSITQILTGHLTREPPTLVLADDRAIAPALMAIVRRALAKMPQERFPSAKAFRKALDQALQGEPAAVEDKAAGPVAEPDMARTVMIGQVEEQAFKKGATLLLSGSYAQQRPGRNRTALLAAGGLLLVGGVLAAGYFALRPGEEPARQTTTSEVRPVTPPLEKSDPVAGSPAQPVEVIPEPPAGGAGVSDRPAPVAPAAESGPVSADQPPLPAPVPVAIPSSQDGPAPLKVQPTGITPSAGRRPPQPAESISALEAMKRAIKEDPPADPLPTVDVEPVAEPTKAAPKADTPPVQTRTVKPKPRVATDARKPRTPKPVQPVQRSAPGGGWGDVRIFREETYRKQ